MRVPGGGAGPSASFIAAFPARPSADADWKQTKVRNVFYLFNLTATICNSYIPSQQALGDKKRRISNISRKPQLAAGDDLWIQMHTEINSNSGMDAFSQLRKISGLLIVFCLNNLLISYRYKINLLD